MFAVAEIAGKQHKVKKGDVLKVEKLKDNKEGDKVKIDKVLLRFDDKKTDVGAPYVSGAAVEFTVKEHGKHEKIRVFKKKPKKRYERVHGHRQHYTEIEITAVK